MPFGRLFRLALHHAQVAEDLGRRLIHGQQVVAQGLEVAQWRFSRGFGIRYEKGRYAGRRRPDYGESRLVTMPRRGEQSRQGQRRVGFPGNPDAGSDRV